MAQTYKFETVKAGKPDERIADLKTLLSQKTNKIVSEDKTDEYMTGKIKLPGVGRELSVNKLFDNVYRLEDCDLLASTGKLKHGTIEWKSAKVISSEDIGLVVAYSVAKGRNLVINTGTHGSQLGENAMTNKMLAELKFAQEDYNIALPYGNVAIHVVTKDSGKVEIDSGVDVAYAWCFSAVQPLDDTMFRKFLDDIEAEVNKAAPVAQTVVPSEANKMGESAKLGMHVDISNNTGIVNSMVGSTVGGNMSITTTQTKYGDSTYHIKGDNVHGDKFQGDKVYGDKVQGDKKEYSGSFTGKKQIFN